MRAAVALLLLGAAPVDGFEGFWVAFRPAAVAGDAKVLARLTRTPFLFEGTALDAKGFEGAVPRLFDVAVRACFKAPKLVADGAQKMLFCRGTIFVFAPTGAGWRFTEIGVDD
jgi:hypothetical protein